MKNLKMPFLGLVLLTLLWMICFKDSLTDIGCGLTDFATFTGRVAGESHSSVAGPQVKVTGRPVFTNSNHGVGQARQTLTEFMQYELDGESFSLLEPVGFSIETHAFIGAGDSLRTGETINFSFQNDGQTGDFPIRYLWLKKHASDSIQNILIHTTVTEFGLSGQSIAGSFGGTYETFSNGVTHHISGSYQVRRQ